MRPKIYVENIFDGEFSEGDVVELHGWVYSLRSSGKVKFLNFRDGTGILQGVLFKGEADEACFSAFEGLTQESSLKLKGKVVPSPKAPGGWEMQVCGIEKIGDSVDYPITPKEHGPDFLLNHRHLWIRSKRQFAIMRVRAQVMAAAREFFDGQGFTAFDSPIFTPNACEGTSDLFEIDYFGEAKAYLAQTGQLYGEAGAKALGKVYTFGPTFRAEKSKTRRHLTEFWMLEPEVAYMDLEGNMELAEDLVSHIIRRVIERRSRELALLERDPAKIEKYQGPFPRIHYKEAAEILEKESKDGFKTGQDFGGGDETILASKFDKPVFVYGYPTAIKAFYMKEDENDPTYCRSVDLLAPEGYGEIIGGGQREENVDVLLKKIQEHQLDPKVFEWYLDLRRYGSTPSSGFGIGIERTVAWICGLQHVRECIPFPRTIYRLQP